MNLLSMDLSLNHSGIIVFRNKIITDVHVITAPTKKLSYSKDFYNMFRLLSNLNEIYKIIDLNKIDYAIIEDYSYSSISNSMMQNGGFIEAVKLRLFKRNIPFRLVSPCSAKLFATGWGRADKDDMVKNTDVDFQKYFKKKLKQVQIEDLCDSYALGRLLYCELMLRSGEIALTDLKKQEIMVFNRVTDKRPVNILATDFCRRC